MAEVFNYTYSLEEQKEVNKIKEKYVGREETPMDKLRRLDKQAEKPGRVIAIVLGIAGSLVMGAGMSIVMEFATTIVMFASGIGVGVLGIAMLSLAYPMYKKITKKERAKIADQIVSLSEEITLN